MSIETPTTSQTTNMSPSKEKSQKSKSDKKSKSSSHSEKKRKRDLIEDNTSNPKTKTKKHKSDKHSSSKTLSAPVPQSEESQSPFHLQTSSLYLPLAPISQKYPLEGLCAEHISPLLLTYYPPFNGVILSYTNPRLCETPFGSTPIIPPTTSQDQNGEQKEERQLLLHNIDEYAPSFTWLTADFLLFKPTRGVVLEGYINLQNEGHLGLVCWNLFNASISRSRLPRDWVWHDALSTPQINKQGEGEDETMTGNGNEGYAEDGLGYWVNGLGEKIEGTVKFRVKEIESSHDKERGFLSIEGSMLSIVEEADLIDAEREGGKGGKDGKDGKGRRLGGEKGLGATSLGVVSEDAEQEGDKKHRRKY